MNICISNCAQILLQMGEEKKFEIKKWARSPEILKKKPFSIHTTKRYIVPDLYKLKFKTEERIKKRPKFDAIVEQKQKSLREQVRYLITHLLVPLGVKYPICFLFFSLVCLSREESKMSLTTQHE